MPNYAERIINEANALAGAVRLANATTGAEDTGIVDAVATLIDGYGQGGGINLIKTVDLRPQFDPGSTSKTTITITDVPENATVFAIMNEGDANILSPDGSHYNYWTITSAFYKIVNGVLADAGAARNNTFDGTNGMVGGSSYGVQVKNGATYTNGTLKLTSYAGLAYNYSPNARYRFYVYDADISPRYV